MPENCLLCEQPIDDSLHLFLHYPFAIESWDLAALANGMTSFNEWLLKQFEGGDQFSLAKLNTILRGIWNQRNSKLWNNSECNAVLEKMGLSTIF